MIVQSFMRDGFELRPIEIELSVVPGLPQFKFLGLPDALIKESEARIKAALRSQGFKIPSSKQVLIQLRPNDVKKRSHGLDLAVAAAFIWETQQLNKPKDQKLFLYGELNFKGEVIVPNDFCDLASHQIDSSVITGPMNHKTSFNCLTVRELKDLCKPVSTERETESESLVRPDLRDLYLSKAQARLAAIIAAGEHPALFAGPPGSGKTTMADYISKILIPQVEEIKVSQQIARYFGEKLSWLPVRKPHHKSTLLSMVGAGRPPEPGEVSRAHGGALIMDEFLEFDPKVQEALREPLESGRIMISRAGASKEFPARFLLLATTNLCPCGQLTPFDDHKCQCRRVKKRSYIERLSGPIIDRFHVVSFSHEYSQDHDVPLEKVREQVKAAREFAIKSRGQTLPNGRLDNADIVKISAIDKMVMKSTSQRRLKSISLIARTIADLEQSPQVHRVHLNEAIQISLLPANRLTVDIKQYI